MRFGVPSSSNPNRSQAAKSPLRLTIKSSIKSATLPGAGYGGLLPFITFSQLCWCSSQRNLDT